MIEQYKTLPWVVRCDNCGDAIGAEDYGGPILFDDKAEAERECVDWQWRLAEDVVTCEGCLEEESLAEAASSPPTPEEDDGRDGREDWFDDGSGQVLHD